METCKNCEHGCHCSDGSSCTSCECKNCDCKNDSLKESIKILSDKTKKE